jgi:muconate cycloisomerase
MSRVARIDVVTADLRLRFSFGHALAARRTTSNVYVRLCLDDGSVGFGEGVPRDYVTGETVETAVAALSADLAPALLGREVSRREEVPAVFEDAVGTLVPQPGDPPPLAARCALELAFLDACGRRFDCSVRSWLDAPGTPVGEPLLRYDAVIPFARPWLVAGLAPAIRLAGIRQVKVKVGGDLDTDLRVLGLLRRILGAKADLRVDANAAWDSEQALAAVARMRAYGISAVEQPVPGEDFDGMRRVTAAIPEMVIADESLRTVDEAERLASTHACDAFNIRVSKCGGLLDSARIAGIAAEHGMAVVVGAQVGESGLLSAAGRHLAASLGAPRYLEGSAGRLLLRDDGTASIGRMAADPSVRGRGHGAAVLAELHRQAALRAVTEVELHAQVTARGFYERAGYTAVGEVYGEAGIAHVTMVRSL